MLFTHHNKNFIKSYEEGKKWDNKIIANNNKKKSNIKRKQDK